MTIAQMIFDGLVWTKYYAVNESIGRREVKLLLYEVVNGVMEEVAQSHPEYIEVSAAFSGASWTLPSNFRMLDVMVVDDAGCTAGYAQVVDNTKWNVRVNSSRPPTSTDPLARIDQSVVTIFPSVTGGHAYYFRTYSESDFTDETKDMSIFAPIIFHSLILSRLIELIQLRHFKATDDPSTRDKHLALMRSTYASMKQSRKPLEVIEGLTEKPNTVIAGQ